MEFVTSTFVEGRTKNFTMKKALLSLTKPPVENTFFSGSTLALKLWLLLLLALSIPTHAQLTYTTDSETITITGHTGDIGSLSIPSTIEGLPVTTIASGAFQNRRDLRSVTIPNSVTDIEDYAFWNCPGLTSMSIPNSVSNIGNSAFAGCTGLTALSVDAENPSFSSVSGVLFNKARTELIQYPLSRAGASYTIPAGVTDIRNDAFSDCTGLGSVSIPNSVSTIENNAFAGCTGLTIVTIPDGVINIGNRAFTGCIGLTAIFVDAENPSFSSVDGVLFNKAQTELIQYPISRAAASYTIPAGVARIGNYAFSICKHLTRLTLANSVTSIGDYAFTRCTGLTSLALPNSVTNIGNGAFSDCTGLTSVALPDRVASIGDYAFNRCTSLTAISVDAENPSFSSVDGVLFNKSQTELFQYPASKAGPYTIPATVTYPRNGALTGCTGLTSLIIPNSATNIGNGTFAGCTNLTAISVGAGNPSLSSVDGVLFNKTQTELVQYPISRVGASYAIPAAVTCVENRAFSGCTALASVSIPSSVASIYGDTFAGCTGLASIFVDGDNQSYSSSEGVLFDKTQTELIQYPLAKVAVSYEVPGSVTTIGYSAFSRCTSLSRVIISKSVTYIGDSAFRDCPSLTAISVDAENPSFSSVNGILFNKARTGLIQCPRATVGAYAIPSSVATIGDAAFSLCTSLTSVTLPNSVATVGKNAFFGCTGLTTVTIPIDALSIGAYSFYSCSNLHGVYFLGIHPYAGAQAFGASQATIYYMPGTTGWGSTYAGRPAVLWNPEAPTDGMDFGVKAGQFGFSATGSNDVEVVVEACDDLSLPVWFPLSTNTLTSGSSYFSDATWTNHSSRIYRLRSP